MLLGWALLLTACGSDKIAMNEVQREDAERQALIEAMKHHPALANGGNAEATGSPINVSTTVPPKVRPATSITSIPRLRRSAERSNCMAAKASLTLSS